MFAKRLPVCARALFFLKTMQSIWYILFKIKIALCIIFKKRKKKDWSCQDCFFIQDNNPQDSNCECSDNVSIYTNLLREINIKSTHSNNMNCCWWHVNKMEWNIKYIFTCTCIYMYIKALNRDPGTIIIYNRTSGKLKGTFIITIY